jgi:serine/threonine-protein kinase
VLSGTAHPLTSRGARLQAAFREAISLPDEDRRRFVEKIGAEDPGLRAEVDELLAADDAATDDGFLAPVLSTAAILDEPADEDCAGRQVGPYTIVRLLGRGGMGSVYLAHRSDVDKHVALKLLDAPLASREANLRFLFERTVLARLDHPHIARLLDAGIVAPSTPYFAMEYVDGEPMTVSAARVDLAERLRLFESVCAAVAYAHQHLVVHRDLKGSNILVDRSGAVKLVDFGIAKVLEEDCHLTGAGHRLMTPDSAAPEQVRGEPISPATDVYGLGLLLFEMLTGMPAYSLRSLTPSQAERLVCEWDPPKPSTLNYRAHGDLDAICLRALEKDPARRYPTASELLADVRRYLSNRPVEARTPTAAYVARKFVARHFVAVTTGTVFALVVLSGLAAVTWQARRANQERARAEHARIESDAVSDFLIGLFEARDPARGRGANPSAQELLARGETKAEQLSGQPLLQARMLDTIARVQASLGQWDRAEPLMQRALDLRQRHLAADHADIAASLQHLASLKQERGRYSDAEPLYAAALAMRRRVLGPHHADLAESLSLYGVFVLRTRRDDRRAEALLREAVDVQRHASGTDDPKYASMLKSLSSVYDFRRQYDHAEPLIREALAIHRRHLGASHPDSISTLNHLGTLLIKRGDFAAAEPVISETLALNRQVFGAAHPHVALAINNLGAIHEGLGDTAKADAAFAEAAAVAQTALGASHPVVAQLQSNRARVLAGLGSLREAETLNLRALEIMRASFGQDHAYVRKVERQLSDVRALQRQ